MALSSPSASRRTGLFITLMLAPAVLSVLSLTYYPMAKGFIMAFQRYSLWDLTNTQFIGLENFRALFEPSSGNIFYLTLWNSVKWVVLSLFFQFMLGFAVALLLQRSFRGRGVYQGIIFFPWALSGFFIGIVWRWMFNGSSGVINDLLFRLHLIDAPIGFLSQTTTALPSAIVANVWYGIPFFAIMIIAALKGVPNELHEAAKIDGAGRYTDFWYVTIPFIKPVLILTTLLRGIWILNMPEIIYSMTGGGPAGSSHIITTYMIEKTMSLDYGLASAIGLVNILILTVYTLTYMHFSKFENVGDMT